MRGVVLQELSDCPYCRCADVRPFHAADGMKSYRCHDCGRAFHVDARGSAEAQGKARDGGRRKDERSDS
jgi:transposase-like protein